MKFAINSEAEFSAWILKNLNKMGHACRIENSIGSGFPDINVCQEGQETWLELKLGCFDAVLLRKEQFAWGMRRTAAGGRVRVFSYCKVHDAISVFVYPLKVIAEGKTSKYVRIVSPPVAVHARANFFQ